MVEDDMVEERGENIDRLCYNGIKLSFLSCLRKKNEDIRKKKESAHTFIPLQISYYIKIAFQN